MTHYSNEELILLGQRIPGLLWIIERHINKKEIVMAYLPSPGDAKGIIKPYADLWDYLKRSLPEVLEVMEEPIEKMPLMINHDDRWIRETAKWRLFIGK